jgi:hypothetical protein
MDSSKLQPIALAALALATPYVERLTAAACEESDAARSCMPTAFAPRHVELMHVEHAVSAPPMAALESRTWLSSHAVAVASASGSLALGSHTGS